MSQEKDFYRYVGEKVRIARNAVGMNQEALAAKVDLKRTSITNIEAGHQKVQIYTLYEIAKVLHVPISSLFPQDKGGLETDKEDLLSKQEVLVNDGTKSNLSESEVADILKVIK